TPSKIPQAFACLISSTLAVSMKNFILSVPPQQQFRNNGAVCLSACCKPHTYIPGLFVLGAPGSEKFRGLVIIQYSIASSLLHRHYGSDFVSHILIVTTPHCPEK